MLLLAVIAATAAATPHVFYPEPALPSGWASAASTAGAAGTAGTAGAGAAAAAAAAGAAGAAGAAAAGTTIDVVTVTLAVREQNMDKIREIARSVSDPDSPRYGVYLSQGQVDEITGPTEADVAAVRSWLIAEQFAGDVEETQAGRFFVLTAPATAVGALLKTTFRRVTNVATGQTTLRASSFALPAATADAVTAVFGVHGLPLPPKRNRATVTDGIPPVTPTVIASTYNVTGVTVDRSGKNCQAVVEFQGQTMNSTDLATFFINEVPEAHAGDNIVAKFVGDAGDSSAKIEASLDIQFIMGVAPGIKTEFWLFNSGDFCGQLLNWTNTILATQDAPLVHSVSYGWQGNLTQIGCKDANIQTIDANFAKLATKGITILISSGDGGSGYAPVKDCHSSAYQNDTAIKGTVAKTVPYPDVAYCCGISEDSGFAGFMFTPSKSAKSEAPEDACTPSKSALVGTVKLRLAVSSQSECCSDSAIFGVGYNFVAKTQTCTIFSKVTGHTSANGTSSATNAMPGTCTMYSAINGTEPAPGKTSVTLWPTQPAVLWPSWPASSPWVTAVGATRFVGQKVGGEEMASDQFGSGGGFSTQFMQSAEWQSAAVAAYIKGAPNLPPNGSFPPLGRATPDVSALGEGFQVYQDGVAGPVGGTSASTPTFAGLVSLLNEARLQANKPPMGFLNPFLYKNANAFFDVVIGTNAIAKGGTTLKYGFDSTKGWDPATGVGTPHFGKLLAAAMGSVP